MAKYDAKKEITKLTARGNKYATDISLLFSAAVNDLLKLATSRDLVAGEHFLFEDNQAVHKKATDILRRLHASTTVAIDKGIELEWGLANDAIDKYVASVFGKKSMSDPNLAGWFQRNTDALKAFQTRTKNGMSLSDRVWRTSEQLKEEMEMAISLSVGEGESASMISRRVRQYLKEPDRLFRRVKETQADGTIKWHLSKAAAAYHPGQGVYRSSYKNAMRLARTETNMAYRTADYERWNQLDFIKGVHIGLSNNHTLNGKPFTDICDVLAGDYPKDFEFKGWHVMCRCVATPILVSTDELALMNKSILKGETPASPSGAIHRMPDNFVEWAKTNKDRIDVAQKRGTLPYFLSDNFKGDIVKKVETWSGVEKAEAIESGVAMPTAPAKTIAERAAERHAARTGDEIKEIRTQWFMRDMANNIPDTEKRAIAENWLDIEDKGGVKKGRRMSIEDADKQSANPNYGQKGFNINCATCAPCYNLRLAGFDFRAKANIASNPDNRWMSYGNSFKVWNNADGTPGTPITYSGWLSSKGYKQMTPDRFKEFFYENCTDEGVYLVTIGWKGGSGHATIVQKFADGTLAYIEPQHFNSAEGVKRDIEKLIKDASPKQISTRGIMRIDNKIFDVKYLSIFDK